MAKKEIVKKVKLQIPAGKATPAPPVGTILGPLGINLQEFCTRYNDETRDKMGDILPVEISLYDDRSFDFVIKTPPASFLLKKKAGLKSASAKGANQVVAVLKESDIREIAEIKMPDLNAHDIEAAMRIVEGTARNMGIAVEGVNADEMAEHAKEAAEAEKEMLKRQAELEKAEQEAIEQAHAEPTDEDEDNDSEDVEEENETEE